jgi:signal transduction histidine kinase
MESIGRLAGGVAHDFNNMLSVIIGYSEFAMRDLEAASDEKNESSIPVRENLKAARRSADLTHQLLAFASKQTVIPRILDLNEATEDVLVMLRRLIGENINLVWMPDSGIMPIYMDPSQLDQILTNICVNARDAIEGTGKIIIETRSARPDERFLSSHPEAIKDDYVMLSVRDNGAGMDSETRERLFEPVFTTKEKGKGTGLGLSSIYGIVSRTADSSMWRAAPERAPLSAFICPDTGQAPIR